MSSTEDEMLRADERLLRHIFPGLQPTHKSILAQNYDSCTFIAHQGGLSGDDVVVRLQVLGEDATRFRSISALQSVARLAMPDLVPATERCGIATTKDGRAVEFSVIKFVPDTVTLESVWDDLEDAEQIRIVQELLEALKQLHALELSDRKVKKALEGTAFATQGSGSRTIIGGPSTGYFTDIQGFLRGIIKRHNLTNRKRTSYLSTDPLTGNITIHFVYGDMGPILIPFDDVQRLQDSVVLCHQDLEPRNVLVRPTKLNDGTTRYQIAAIVDWEMAGLFPFSYEYVQKDLFLGNSNLYYSWYALFKELGAPLVPMSPLPRFHALFMKAIELIRYSQERAWQNVPVLMTIMWIEREGVVRREPAGTGWSKHRDAPRTKRITTYENDELAERALQALGLS